MKTAWNTTTKKKSYPRLGRNMTADVVIVGGGLVGIQSAYLLACEGKKVVVLEKKTLGNDATEHTTAFITAYIDTDAADMERLYGKKSARLIYESGQRAIQDIESTIEKESIDCKFTRTSNYVYAKTDKDQKALNQEYSALRKIGGLQSALHTGSPLPGFKNSGALEIKNQAKFHPLKYLYQLAQRAQSLGVEIFENTEADKITAEPYLNVTCGKYTVAAHWAVNATYDPLGNPIKTKFKKGMYTSYVLELEAPKGKIPEGLYEDTDNPYHYMRVDRNRNYDRILLGGADHRSELPMSEKKNFQELQQYAREIFPDLKFKIVRKWNRPILEPTDGLPLIGLYKPCTLVAAAFSGNGMTYSMVAARMFRDIISRQKNPYTKLYDPTRIPTVRQLLKKGKDYTEEFLKGAVKNSVKY